MQELGESYAQLLKRAIRRPSSLAPQDSAHIAPEDRRLLVETIDAASTRIDVRLAEIRTSKKGHPIGEERWQNILARTRSGELLMSELSIHEVRAIDNNPELTRQLAEADE